MDLIAREASRPIQVYLDSSDYSRLSDPDGDHKKQARQIEALLQATSSGAIVLRYSAAIVSEAAPTTPSSIAKGVLRLRMIKSLCGRNCLRFMSDVIRGELLGASAATSAFSDTGEWVPKVDLANKFHNLREELGRQLESMPRPIRRRYIEKQGGHIRRANELLGGPALKELLAEFPIADRAIPVVSRFLEGKASAEAASIALLEGLSDLDKLAALFVANFGKAEKLMTWVRGAGAQHVDRVAQLRVSRISTGASDDLICSAVDEAKTESLNSLRLDIGASWRKAFLEPGDKFIPFDLGIDLEAAVPTLNAMITAVAEVMKSTTSGKYPRRAKASDVGDIYNGLYIPHVHVFRCDRAMADTLAPVAARYGTTLCEDLDELVEAVGSLG